MGVLVAVEHQHRTRDGGEGGRLDPLGLQAEGVLPGLGVPPGIHPQRFPLLLRQGVDGLRPPQQLAEVAQQAVALLVG